jgi:acetyl esterase/lipase
MALATGSGLARAQEATPVINTELGVAYGTNNGADMLLDVYRPADQSTAHAAVLVFYPGAMTAGERSWMAAESRGLAEAGYVAFAPDYRLLGADGSNQWPAQLDDAQRAVRWVRANADSYGVDPDRVGAYGFSAGGTLVGHLASRDTRDNADAELADYSSRVQCAVNIVGTTDLTIPPFDSTDDTARLTALLGGSPAEVPEAWEDFSVVNHVDSATSPFLIFHSAVDTIISVEHSRRLADILRVTEVEMVYAELAGIGHLDWIWALSGPLTLAFLGRHLQPGE